MWSKRVMCGLVVFGCALSACSEKSDGANNAGGKGQPDAGDKGDAAQARDDAGEAEPDAKTPGDDAGNMPGADAGDDAGGTADVSACLDAAQSKDSRTEALELLGKDGTQIAFVRYVDPDAFGTSGTTVWLPERLGYARGAATACVTETDKLMYAISHHNFDDTMDAQVGDLTVTFHQARVDYDMPWSFTAEAKRGESVVWGPIELEVVSCKDLTSDEDCTEKYQ